jgi:hypothetical protein
MKAKRKNLFISVIVLLVLGVYAFSIWSIADDISQLKETAIQSIKADELHTIKNMIQENYDKAELQADQVKGEAEQKILEYYADNTDQLRYDLEHVGDNPVYNILQDSITGKYLNVVNDNNDMWVWVPPIGKTNDTSKNCAFEKGQSVTIDGEIAKQFNKVLAKIALDSIINQENKPWTFWNYLPQPSDYYVPTTMDESEVDKLFWMYGYKGLQYLEFLKPVYLRQHSDILGIKDVDQNGIKTNNDKIIFVQGFNIVDDLESNHKDLLQYYDAEISHTADIYDMKRNGTIAFGVVVSSVLLIGFLSIVRDYNKGDKIETI